MTSVEISAIVVVVPAHDEAELLGRCLDALARAIDQSPVPCVVRIVLDACSDASAEIAAQWPFPVLALEANAVGVARASGIDSALQAIRATGGRPPPSPQGIWIANTDADSVVHPSWLSLQCELADEGADVLLGTVRPDFADLAPPHREHWLRTHTPGAPAGNTHGANLGIRASTYLAAGGFPCVARNEDVRLVETCRASGAHVRASDRAEVMTSGRSEGRAPGGYADFVRETALRFAATC